MQPYQFKMEFSLCHLSFWLEKIFIDETRENLKNILTNIWTFVFSNLICTGKYIVQTGQKTSLIGFSEILRQRVEAQFSLHLFSFFNILHDNIFLKLWQLHINFLCWSIFFLFPWQEQLQPSKALRRGVCWCASESQVLRSVR